MKVSSQVVGGADLTLTGSDVRTADGVLNVDALATTVQNAYTTSAANINGTTTAGDISLSAFSGRHAGGNPTVTIKNDRIIVKGNIDIDGVVNSTAIQSLQTLQVTDNYIEVADLDYEVTGAAEATERSAYQHRAQRRHHGRGRRRGHVPSSSRAPAAVSRLYTAGVFDQATPPPTRY
jgi:hypothetical protein